MINTHLKNKTIVGSKKIKTKQFFGLLDSALGGIVVLVKVIFSEKKDKNTPSITFTSEVDSKCRKGVRLVIGYIKTKLGRENPVFLDLLKDLTINVDMDIYHAPVEKMELIKVKGPSLSLGIGIAIYAGLFNLSIRPHTCISGSVNKYGTLEDIGGLVNKLEAASQANMRRIILPKISYENTYLAKHNKGIFKYLCLASSFGEALSCMCNNGIRRNNNL